MLTPNFNNSSFWGGCSWFINPRWVNALCKFSKMVKSTSVMNVLHVFLKSYIYFHLCAPQFKMLIFSYIPWLLKLLLLKPLIHGQINLIKLISQIFWIKNCIKCDVYMIKLVWRTLIKLVSKKFSKLTFPLYISFHQWEKQVWKR